MGNVREWWHGLIVYQVYPMSFQDSNGDGIGDIRGVINRLDYIQNLGVNMIWLNPIFKSPKVDNGYDISDFLEIDPIFGTMAEVEELILEAHKRGIKVIFDFVMNHTSEQHPWFQEALKGKDNPYRDYYIWADGKTAGRICLIIGNLFSPELSGKRNHPVTNIISICLRKKCLI